MFGFDMAQIVGFGLHLLIFLALGAVAILAWRRMAQLRSSIDSLRAAATNLHALVAPPAPPQLSHPQISQTLDDIRQRLIGDLDEADARQAAQPQSADALRNWALLRAASAVTYAYKRAEAAASNELRVAGIGATAELTTAGFQSLVLINGGAVVAVLTLIGTVWSSNKDTAKAMLATAKLGLLGFGAGLAFAILGIGLAFLAQVAFQQSQSVTGKIWRWGAFLAGVASLAGFAFGAWSVAAALTGV
ncbi:MAG TPA: hypothetical protein VMQ73_19345 [Methylomirabilota bacterium]|nr:hypothetical protein [Methylomirabilota bacterium]